MNKYAGYIVAVLVGVLIGYFAGREHLKYEMRSAFESAAAGLSESWSSAFSGDSDRESLSAEIDESNEQEAKDLEDAVKAAYIDEYVELYDLSAKYIDTFTDKHVPGVQFKLRNNGERSLDRVEVTVYFKDENGNIITEENFPSVSVNRYSSDNKPLRPGYIWQMGSGSSYHTVEQVPSEWKEGSIEISITDIRFTE